MGPIVVHKKGNKTLVLRGVPITETYVGAWKSDVRHGNLRWYVEGRAEVMTIWFIVQVGADVVVYEDREDFPGYAALKKEFFREDGTPVLAVVRPKRQRGATRAGFAAWDAGTT